MGWRLERSKARSEYTAGHGLYRIVDVTSGAYVAGGEPYPFSLLLKDAEALLLGHHPQPPKEGLGNLDPRLPQPPPLPSGSRQRRP
jgi:hypothetical protein